MQVMSPMKSGKIPTCIVMVFNFACPQSYPEYISFPKNIFLTYHGREDIWKKRLFVATVVLAPIKATRPSLPSSM